MTDDPMQSTAADRRGLRLYFYLLPVYLGSLVTLTYCLPDDGMGHWIALTLAYYSLCCTFIPLPTTAIMVWLAVMGMDPWLMACVATVGTTLANLFDYQVITFLMGYNLLERGRDTTFYRAALRWFDRRPLVTLAVWNAIPFSMDVARWVAAVRRYPRPWFMLGTVVGRWPRYLAIGLVTQAFGLEEWVVGLLLLLSLVAGVTRALLYLCHFWRSRRRIEAETNDSNTPSEGAAHHDDPMACPGC
jgi:membrane protein YqaA with SNARE-associated domain